MNDLFKDTICLATVAHNLEERATMTTRQYQEGQINVTEKEEILRTLDRVQCVPIVPRKIVEMIIEECERNEITNHKYGNYCAENNLEHIREYAESLLKQFEEDKDE